MTTDDYLRLPPVPAEHRVHYGPDSSQFGDLYLPKRPGPRPVVIVIHGGCWSEPYGLHPLGGLCAALAAQGYAVWSLEYRRLDGGGGWPATFTDVAAGADELRALAVPYALDLTRVVAIGHSAGGHLALWLAGRHRLPRDSELYSRTPLPIHGVVSLAGVPDLAEGARRGLCGAACSEVVGGTRESVPARYAEGSPIELAPLGVPQWHLVGRDDAVIPADYVTACADSLRRHDDVRLEVIPGAGHFELVVPKGDAWDALLRALKALEARAAPAAGERRGGR